MEFFRRRPLTCILGLGLFLRLLIYFRFLCAPELFLTPDSGLYWDLAKNLRYHAAFSLPVGPDTTPHTFRTPAYPAYLAFWIWIFGEKPPLIILTQIGLGLAAVYITYRFASAGFHPYAGYWAAGFLAVNPILIFCDNRIQTETLSLFFQLVCVFSAWRFVNRSCWVSLFFSGLCMALSVLTRPFYLYFFPLVWLYVLFGIRRDWKSTTVAGLLWLLVFSTPVGGWIHRNWIRTGIPSVSSIGGYNFLETRAAHVYQYKYGLSVTDAIQRVYRELDERMIGHPATEAERTREAQKLSFEIVLQNPGIFLRCCWQTFPGLYWLADNSYYYLLWHGTSQVPAYLPLWEKFLRRFFWTLPQQVFLLLIYLLMFLGLGWVYRNRGGKELIFFLATILYPAVILLGANTGMPRYRIPSEPFIAVLAGAGIAVFAFRFHKPLREPAPLPPDAAAVICIPVFNEKEKIPRLLDQFPPDLLRHVVVVNDGSTDETDTVLTRYPVAVIRHTENQGVGVAIRAVAKYGREHGYPIMVVMAGNGKDDPREIPALIQPLLENRAVYVQGSRFSRGGRHVNTPWFRYWTIKIYTWIFNLFSPAPNTDVTNGFRAYRLDLFDDPRIHIDQPWLDRYEMEYYIHFKAFMLGYPVAEAPVSKCYPTNKKISYSKIRPWVDWWKMIRPMLFLFLRIKE